MPYPHRAGPTPSEGLRARRRESARAQSRAEGPAVAGGMGESNKFDAAPARRFLDSFEVLAPLVPWLVVPAQRNGKSSEDVTFDM